MFPLGAPSLAFAPLRFRPHGVGNWSGHLSFAVDLITSLKPNLLVELGTYYGESYFAFCQAIHEQKLQCTAYAVDTWHGDLHLGKYGESVYNEVALWNEQHYGGWSTLLRMPFDNAADRFAPESIDLLHLDGLHTYEAVRRDFEKWFPKVRTGGVILLHDIVERHLDFGVWKVWEELRQTYPSFEFHHSSGLGIILKRGDPPATGVGSLMFASDPALADSLRKYYLMCAEAMAFRQAQNGAQEQDVVTQLFWRNRGESFSEDQSVTVLHPIASRPTRVELEIPAVGSALCEFRLDLANQPMLLRFYGIKALDVTGAEVWRLHVESDEELHFSDMLLTVDETGDGGVVSVTGTDCSLLLPADPDLLERLAGGGVLRIEIRILEIDEYTRLVTECHQRTLAARDCKLSLMRADKESELRVRETELAGIRRHLDEIETSRIWRVVKPLRSLKLNVRPQPNATQH